MSYNDQETDLDHIIDRQNQHAHENQLLHAKMSDNQGVIEENAENRSVMANSNDIKREARWKARYWIAIAVMFLVISATWFSTNYYTHYYGTLLYPGVDSTASMVEQLKQQKELIQQLHDQVKSKTITKIWFDRKRKYTDLKFAVVDSQFPAGHELWEDGELIERWHWRIEGQPKTYQFGDYILRCVSTYDEKGEYSGFTQTVISHYPNDTGTAVPINNSLEYTLNINDNSFSLKSYDKNNEGMQILWKEGKVMHTHLHTRDFMHSKQNGTDRDLYSIIQVPEQMTYLTHLSKMFPFIKKDVLEPFKKSIRYERFKELSEVKILNSQ